MCAKAPSAVSAFVALLAPRYPETLHVVISIVFYEQTYMLQHWDTQILPQLIPVIAINS